MMILALILSVAAVLAGLRFYWGPTWPDRVLIFDLLTSIMIASTVLYAITSNDRDSVSLILVLALLSFVSSVSLVFYLEHTGRRRR